MREIEFKVYVKDKNKIYDVKEIDFVFKFVKFEEENKPTDTLRMFDQVELLQFTGLTDKNGKKIFEGDIVKCGNSVYVIDFGFHYSIPSDPYDYGRAYGFYFLNENKDEYYSIDDETDIDVEVIGNIYDNKELVEEI